MEPLCVDPSHISGILGWTKSLDGALNSKEVLELVIFIVQRRDEEFVVEGSSILSIIQQVNRCLLFFLYGGPDFVHVGFTSAAAL